MKALVKSRDGRGLWLENVPEPEFGINDVKIRVLSTGICGTDLHIYDWDDWARSAIRVPLVIGHEFAGEVVEVGSNVADLYPGDLVSGEGHVPPDAGAKYPSAEIAYGHGARITEVTGPDRPSGSPRRPGHRSESPKRYNMWLRTAHE